MRIDNERARATAQAAGRDTYPYDVVDTWPACTACGTPIRRTITTARLGLWRACRCPDVLWRLRGTSHWEKVTAAPQTGTLAPEGP